MNETLYQMMDWAGIEALVYSEEDHPHALLGPHKTGQGILVQTFQPAADHVDVIIKKAGKEQRVPMELADNAGFYAVLLDLRDIPDYVYERTEKDGNVVRFEDPYRFESMFSPSDGARFQSGICYDLYLKMGARVMTVDGVSGVAFSVWAPNAVRVSLVGDFNEWDGRTLPMRRLDDYGIFELFVPGLTEGTIYKYEIKARGGLTYLKADPMARSAEVSPGTASVVAGDDLFSWTDDPWMERRDETDLKSAPMNVYEVHLSTFRRTEDGRIMNYREMAPVLADYVRNMGYTHVELMPVMEYPHDDSMGYQTTGYYAPTSRYGSPSDFKYFMNYMHSQGIGVILDFVCSHFPRDLHGLGGFDGTCLYEHQDPRQGVHPAWNTLLFNYGRPEVSNYLISAALYWLEVYHADGLRLNDVSTILYLDYGKQDGQWVANMYGGNENLEGMEFIKHLNSIAHKRCGNILMIAEEKRGWPGVTDPLEKDGLGFDLKWNDSFTADLFSYMELDPIFRGPHHSDLTFSMIYHYSEDYMLALSHDEVVAGRKSFTSRMPGKPAGKRANLKAMLGYTMMHPGKKLLFMGQEFGSAGSWNASLPLDWVEADSQDLRSVREYVRALNLLYRSHPALYEYDQTPDGFEWINEISANENMLVFLRKAAKEDDMLLVVCNFSALVYENHKIGVPFQGKYKELFNSDRREYGGNGNVNPRLKNAKLDECDGRDYSIRITVPPLGISVFSCTRVERALSENEKLRAKDTRKKAVGTNGTVRKKTVKPSAEEEESLKERLARKVEEEDGRILGYL